MAYLKDRGLYETRRNEMVEWLMAEGYDRKKLISAVPDTLYTIYHTVKRNKNNNK